VVAGGLAQIVSDEIERYNEEDMLARCDPDQGAECEGARCLSETLGVPASHLIQLDEKRWEECCDANELILSLRGATLQAQADAFEQAAERLRPLMEDHPGMTVEEAVRELTS
jgi:hypothetical protein